MATIIAGGVTALTANYRTASVFTSTKYPFYNPKRPIIVIKLTDLITTRKTTFLSILSEVSIHLPFVLCRIEMHIV